MSGSSSSSQQQTTTTNVDKRVSTAAGGILAVQDNTISGGVVNITNADADVAKAAIEAASNVAGAVMDTASNLTGASNKIASQVADSQRAFVETASGQKMVLYAIAALAAAGLAFIVIKNK